MPDEIGVSYLSTSTIIHKAVLACLITCIALIAISAVPAAIAATITVPGNYSTIQAAVDAAADGDTIQVGSGNYTENLEIIDKTLILIGVDTGAGRPVLNGSGNTTIAIFNKEGVTIRGFVVTGGKGPTGYLERAGIFIDCDNAIIADNIVSGNYNGIYVLDGSRNASVTGNTATDNYYGIHLLGGNHKVTGNTATNNHIGIYLDRCSNADVTGNTAGKNTYRGIFIGDGSNNRVTDNTVSDNGVLGIYLSSTKDNVIWLNTFSNAINTIWVSGTNYWNSTTEMVYIYNGTTYTSRIGNHWNDYEGADGNGDGIGDTPYTNGGVTVDWYPLTGAIKILDDQAENPLPGSMLTGMTGAIDDTGTAEGDTSPTTPTPLPSVAPSQADGFSWGAGLIAIVALGALAGIRGGRKGE